MPEDKLITETTGSIENCFSSLCWNSKVEAEDPDAGVNGQIQYSIDFGNQNDYFSIDENSGAITLMKMIPLEAHQTLEFLLFLTARDGRCEQCPVLINPFSSAAHSQLMMMLFFSSRRRSVPLHLSAGADYCCWRYKAAVHTEHLQRHHRRRERPRNSDRQGELLCKLNFFISCSRCWFTTTQKV